MVPRSFQYLSFVPSGLYPYHAGFSIRAGPPREKSLSAHTLAQDSQQPVSPREKSVRAHTLAQDSQQPVSPSEKSLRAHTLAQDSQQPVSPCEKSLSAHTLAQDSQQPVCGTMATVVPSLSCVQLFATPWTTARQAPRSFNIFEYAQTHVRRVSDAIQPSHPLSPPSPPALNLSQHQGLFQ